MGEGTVFQMFQEQMMRNCMFFFFVGYLQFQICMA